jgi:hypothetical protein
MKTSSLILQRLALLVLLSTLNYQHSTALAQGTAFSYQGRLGAGGNPANGIYDFRFTIYDAVSNGTAVSGFLTNSATPVTNGLFAVALDFGPGVFTGPGRWLQVDVRTSGVGVFTSLSPRQPILPTPYTMMASGAGSLLGTLPASQLSGTVALGQLPASVVTNGATGLTLAGSFSGSGAGLTGINGSAIQNGTVGSAQLAAGAVTATNLAPGVGSIPAGTIVLSETPANAALTASGFAPMLTGMGANWSLGTNAAAWDPRDSMGVLAMNDRMWVLGGERITAGAFVKFFNDVWSSSNGVTWTQASSGAPWSARRNFGVVALNGQMWVLGGYGGNYVTGYYTNDVWSSSDGASWVQVTNSARWSARAGFAAVAFNNQMWVLGGSGFSDVWSSSDGANWTRVTNAAPWGARSGLQAVAFNGQMWVLGGGSYNDVWSSRDGANWTLVTASAQWAGRGIFGAMALNSQMWVVGGYASGLGWLNDAWSSRDGASWSKLTDAAPWGARPLFSAVGLNGQLWVMGGQLTDTTGWNSVHDTWLSQNTTNNTLGGFYLFQKQ